MIGQPAPLEQAPDLRVSLSSDGDATFADEINERYHNIVRHGEAAFAEAIRIGELLVANKAAVRHGDWVKWIEKNIVFDIRTAQNYMRLFEQRDVLKNESVSYLTKAYALLAEKTGRQPAPANGEQQAAAPTDPKPKPAVAEPEQKHKSVEDEIPAGPEDSAEVRWRRGLLERAQSAEAYAAFGDWSQFKVDSELVNAATLAADAWKKLADYLRSRRLPLPPDEGLPF